MMNSHQVIQYSCFLQSLDLVFSCFLLCCGGKSRYDGKFNFVYFLKKKTVSHLGYTKLTFQTHDIYTFTQLVRSTFSHTCWPKKTEGTSTDKTQAWNTIEVAQLFFFVREKNTGGVHQTTPYVTRSFERPSCCFFFCDVCRFFWQTEKELRCWGNPRWLW